MFVIRTIHGDADVADVAELRQLWKRGRIDADTPVYQRSRGRWIKLREVDDFLAALTADDCAVLEKQAPSADARPTDPGEPLVSIPEPPKPDEFVVRGPDGKNYPASVDALRQWARAGRLNAATQVYSRSSGQWFVAGQLPVLADILVGAVQAAPQPAAHSPQKTSSVGGCLAVGCLVFIILGAIGSLIDTSRPGGGSSPSSSPTPSSSSARPLDEQVRITAANLFTSRYASSAFSGWNIRGQAAGPGCEVLLVSFGVNMDDSMIQAMHYGRAAYGAIYDGGVQHFSRERGFAAVVYRDASGGIWRYGPITRSQAESLSHC